MAVSKINEADAQEWLESLQQVGEGWYRQVALAVRANAHKALGMERKEFAQAIGQKLVDSREAIIQLHNEGHSIATITDVLSVSEGRVNVVLLEEGYIDELPAYIQKRIDAGAKFGQTTDLVGDPGQESTDQVDKAEGAEYEEVDVEALESEIQTLNTKVKGEQAKRRREVAELQEKVRNAAKDKAAALRKQKADILANMTDQERARIEKESEAWVQEQTEGMLTDLAQMLVTPIVGALHEAAQGLHDLVGKGYVTTSYLQQIEQAHASFVDELNVARMSEKS